MKIKTIVCAAVLATAALATQASAAGAATYTQVGGNLSGHTVLKSCTSPSGGGSSCTFTLTGKVPDGPLSGSHYSSVVTLTQDTGNSCGVLSGGLKLYNSHSANILQLKYRPTSVGCIFGAFGESGSIVDVVAFLVPSTTASAQKGTFAGTNGGEVFFSLIGHPWDTTVDSGSLSGVLRS